MLRGEPTDKKERLGDDDPPCQDSAKSLLGQGEIEEVSPKQKFSGEACGDKESDADKHHHQMELRERVKLIEPTGLCCWCLRHALY